MDRKDAVLPLLHEHPITARLNGQNKQRAGSFTGLQQSGDTKEGAPWDSQERAIPAPLLEGSSPRPGSRCAGEALQAELSPWGLLQPEGSQSSPAGLLLASRASSCLAG